MLWIKALHIVFMVTWFAGLFYLPRLFVYHALATDREGAERFKVMERKLFLGIMTPGAVLTIAFGLWLWLGYGVGAGSGWMHAKLGVVILLLGYNHACGALLKKFEAGVAVRSHVWFRWFNEAPVLMLLAAVVLAVVKPF
jgi:putative membrane protein